MPSELSRIHATAARRALMQAQAADPLLPLADDRILTLKTAAEVAGLGLPTLRRRIVAGDGPTVTRLSPRRVGVRVGHLRAWLDARAEART